MIYSRFGTALTLVSKTLSAGGKVSIQATATGAVEVLEYNLADLKADNGPTEIEAAVEGLPMKSFESKSNRRRSRL